MAEELDSLLDSKILRSCKKKKKKEKNLSNGYYVIEIFDIPPRIYKFPRRYSNETLRMFLISKSISFIWNEIKRSRGKQWLMYVCLTKKLDCYVNFGIWDVQVLIFKEEFWLFKSF